MPYDSNGNFSLPAGYVARDGDTIVPSQHNPPLEDIAAALNSALLRSGVAPMTAALKAVQGSAAVPGLTFNGATSTGFYKSDDGIGFAINGVKAFEVTDEGISVQTSYLIDKAVTYAKIQDATHGKLLGRLSVSAGVVEEVVLPFAQCRLAKSGSNLVLSPYRGNRLTINSLIETIPDAGVSLAPTGLTPSTLYYIYAYMNSGTMTLEASTTASAVQTGTGIDIKSGDATRTLVGIAYPATGPAWVDSSTQRYVRSRFNEGPISLSGAYTSTHSTTSTTLTEVDTEIRVEFITWASELVDFHLQTFATNSTQGGLAYSRIAFDGSSANSGVSVQAFTAGGGNSMTTRAVSSLTVGYHYATMLGQANTGTASWNSTTLLSGLLRA